MVTGENLLPFCILHRAHWTLKRYGILRHYYAIPPNYYYSGLLPKNYYKNCEIKDVLRLTFMKNVLKHYPV